MSRETHFSIQGKRRNQSEHEIQAEMDQNKPKYPNKLAKDKPCPMGLEQWTLGQPKYQVWGRLEPRAGRPTTMVG